MESQPLGRYVFVFTGDMSIEREEAKGKVLLLGARVTTSVSSKTTHLVAGTDPGPSKIKKAQELGIKTINEDEFMRIVALHGSDIKNTSIAIKPIGGGAVSTKNVDCTNGCLPWAEKYRPQTIGDLIGNKSVVEQLNNFVLGMGGFKAAFVSGPPGVGKTTAALAVCRANNVVPIEFNASDVRNKRSIIEHISVLVNSFAISRDMKACKKVMIMDEIDGMTSDRGGIPELVNVIKQTKVPIICICNDKTHIKMRSLANHCLNVHFRKLDGRSIFLRIKDILNKEGRSLSDDVLNEVIAISNGDMRYALNTVQSIAERDTVALEYVSKGLVRKNALRGTFEIAAELFHRRSIAEKIDIYFEDYSLMPLFVHENYLKCTFKSLKDLLVSSESISFSDILDARIHGSEQEWSLLPYHGFFSVVYPLSNKTLQKRIEFPSFLGQNSKMSKNSRLLSLITSHLKFKTTRRDFRMFMADTLYSRFIKLLKDGKVDSCIELIKSSELLKDDIMNIGEVLGTDILKSVNAKLKAAFTREYKKCNRNLPYTTFASAVENKESCSDEKD